MSLEAAIVQAVVAGVIGGAITGAMAVAVIRVELLYLRRDVDKAHKRIDWIERTHQGVRTDGTT